MQRKSRRDPRKERRWRALLQEHRDSGLTVKEFCERERQSENTFRWWLNEIRRRNRERGVPEDNFLLPNDAQRSVVRPAGISFVPVTLTAEPVSEQPNQELKVPGLSSVEVVTPSGYILRICSGTDIVTLQHVLKAIRGAASEC